MQHDELNFKSLAWLVRVLGGLYNNSRIDKVSHSKDYSKGIEPKTYFVDHEQMHAVCLWRMCDQN